jgi:hypothetical protein
MRFWGLPAGGENKIDKKSVLLDHAKLVALLADDVPVSAELPRCIRLFH